MAIIPTHFRFWILRLSSVQVFDPSAWLRTGFRLSEEEFSHCIQDLCFMLFSPIQNPKSKIENLKLSNDFIRAGEDFRHDGHADLFRRFQIDRGFENPRLLDRELVWFRAF